MGAVVQYQPRQQQQQRNVPQAPAGAPEPPNSIEAEMALLGAIMQDSDLFYDAYLYVRSDDFYSISNAAIFEAMSRILLRGDAIDSITVGEELKTCGEWDALGGEGGGLYLSRLVNAPRRQQLMTYAKTIQDLGLRRRLMGASRQAFGLAMDRETPASEAWAQGLALIETTRRDLTYSSLGGTESIAMHNDQLSALRESLLRNERTAYTLPDKWSDLKPFIEVITTQSTIVVSGQSGGGKTAFCEVWAEWFAQFDPVEYIYTEQSQKDMLDRRACRWAGIPYAKLVTGDLNESERAKMDAANAEIAKWAHRITYTGMSDPAFEDVQARMKRAATRGVKVFFIDNFQDLKSPAPKRGEETNEIKRLDRMVNWFQAFADKRNVIVVIASQLNDSGKVMWTRKLIHKCKLHITIKHHKLQSEQSYWRDGVEFRLKAGEKAAYPRVSIEKNRFGKEGGTNMLYHGAGFDWMDRHFGAAPTPELAAWVGEPAETEDF